MIIWGKSGKKITIIWGKSGKGRWHKRRLAKAERKAAKAEITGARISRNLRWTRSAANYKGS